MPKGFDLKRKDWVEVGCLFGGSVAFTTVTFVAIWLLWNTWGI